VYRALFGEKYIVVFLLRSIDKGIWLFANVSSKVSAWPDMLKPPGVKLAVPFPRPSYSIRSLDSVPSSVPEYYWDDMEQEAAWLFNCED
jgi:hypothetical protein